MGVITPEEEADWKFNSKSAEESLFEKNDYGDAYPRVYLKDHPWIDYYQVTPNGTYFTPKVAMKCITLKSVITKKGATFAEAFGLT